MEFNRLAAVRRAASESGRLADAITPALFASVAITPDAASGRAALEGFSRASYRMELEQLETMQTVAAGPAEHVAAALRRYVSAGARHLVLRIAVPSLRAQREQLALIAELFPLLRRGVQRHVVPG